VKNRYRLPTVNTHNTLSPADYYFYYLYKQPSYTVLLTFGRRRSRQVYTFHHITRAYALTNTQTHTHSRHTYYTLLMHTVEHTHDTHTLTHSHT